jgi:DeoR family transcriptional regulator of aga operon
VVTDSSKLGRVAFAQICRLDAVDELITDEGATREAIRELTEAGITVTVA